MLRMLHFLAEFTYDSGSLIVESSMPRGALARVPRARVANRAVRRRQLIRSTIDEIARRGFSETTLANVADGAGLSRGLVNFHFRSKEALLEETLRSLRDEYRAVWMRALERAGPSPAERLEALALADFDPRVCNRKKIAVWYAFFGEAKSRPTYMSICAAKDEEHFRAMVDLCRAVLAEGGEPPRDARVVAAGLSALSDGCWLDILLSPRDADREAGRCICLEFLHGMFPGHFPAAAARTGAAGAERAR